MDMIQTLAASSSTATTVLIYSRDKKARTQLSGLVESAGSKSITAISARQVVHLNKAIAADLILLDAEHNNAPIVEIITQLRADTCGQSIPILLLHSTPETSLINAAFAAGASDICTTPQNRTLLQHQIRQQLQTSQILQQHRLYLPATRERNQTRAIGLGHWQWDRENDRFSCSDRLRRLLPSLPQEATLDDYLVCLPSTQRAWTRHHFHRTAVRGGKLAMEHAITETEAGTKILRLQGHARHSGDSSPLRLSGTFYDVSLQQPEQSNPSPLTSITTGTEPHANVRFEKALDSAIEEAEFHQCSLALLYLDLDDFRRVGLQHGEAVAEQCLQAVENMLSQIIAGIDQLPGITTRCQTLRLENDAFVLMLPGGTSQHDPSSVAEQILQKLDRPDFTPHGLPRISASIGIAVRSPGNESETSLLQQARTALHRAKNNGKNQLHLAGPATSPVALHAIPNHQHLETALEKQEFQLRYQPQVSLENGNIVAAEALLRWYSNGHLPGSPSRILSLAEEHSLMLPIDKWVLKTACNDLRHWMDLGNTDLSLSLNLSRTLFFNKNLVAILDEALSSAGISPRRITLEIDESCLLSDAQAAPLQCHALHELGCRLAIDNFAAANTSLDLLKRIQPQYLKLSRYLTRDLGAGNDNHPLAVALIQMGRHLGIEMIAQGVETRRQLEAVESSGCNFAQGFFISKPLQAEALQRMVVGGQHRRVA